MTNPRNQQRGRDRPIPFLIMLLLHNQFGSPLSREAAKWRATTLLVVGVIAIPVAIFSKGQLQYLATFWAVVAPLVALLVWLAIRWVDRKDAWNAFRAKRRIEFRLW
jgi:hypothetical protein